MLIQQFYLLKIKFNIIKDFKGDKVILKSDLISRFYDFSELERVLKDIQEEKQKNSVNMELIITIYTWKKKKTRTNFLKDLKKYLNLKGEIYGRDRKIRNRGIRNE